MIFKQKKRYCYCFKSPLLLFVLRVRAHDFYEEMSHLSLLMPSLLRLFCVCLPASVILTHSVFPSVHFSLAHILLQDMHIISTDEKQVFAAVQEWNQNNTYSLYISDSPGVYFILSLENLRTSRGPAGNLLVDFYKVCS